MGAEQNMAVVRQAYELFGQGDLASLLELYDDEAAHIVPGSSKISGSHKGKESITALYGALFELTNGTVRVELQDVMSDGDSRALSTHIASLEKDGESYAMNEALLFTFHDGKIVEIQDFFTDIDLNDRLFS